MYKVHVGWCSWIIHNDYGTNNNKCVSIYKVVSSRPSKHWKPLFERIKVHVHVASATELLKINE